MNIIAWLRTPLATLIVLCSALLLLVGLSS